MTNKDKKERKLATQMNSFWERNEASDGILLKETLKKQALSIFRAILLFGMCFMIIQPILNKLSISVMSEKDLYDTYSKTFYTGKLENCFNTALLQKDTR